MIVTKPPQAPVFLDEMSYFFFGQLHWIVRLGFNLYTISYHQLPAIETGNKELQSGDEISSFH